MIGQTKLKEELFNLFTNNKLNNTIILEAPSGYGKKEFIKWFSEKTGVMYKLFSNKIDSIRDAIKQAQNEYTIQFYVFENIELNKLSQNAALKFFEEPPKNIYIFLLCDDTKLLLPTIQNRAIKYKFESYKLEELKTFNSNPKALDIFTTPKELLDIQSYNLEDLLQLVDKIIDKLDLAGISNALKLNQYLKTTNEEIKDTSTYTVDIFTKALRYTLLKKYEQTLDPKLLEKFKMLQKAMNHLKVNSNYFMDNFLLRNYIRNKQWTLKN